MIFFWFGPGIPTGEEDIIEKIKKKTISNKIAQKLKGMKGVRNVLEENQVRSFIDFFWTQEFYGEDDTANVLILDYSDILITSWLLLLYFLSNFLVISNLIKI